MTLALLLAVGIGLYLENNRGKKDAEGGVEDNEVVETPAATGPEAQNEAIAQKLAAMEAEVERQRMAHENEMLRLREELTKTEVERDAERAERERMELQLKRRVAQIRSAAKLTSIVEVFPEQGFVVIGAGDSKNVSVGQRFRVRRGDKIVGQVEITSVDVENAVADPVQGTMVREEGDDTWLLVGDDIISLE